MCVKLQYRRRAISRFFVTHLGISSIAMEEMWKIKKLSAVSMHLMLICDENSINFFIEIYEVRILKISNE